MIGTSSPAEDNNVYATPAATPPPAPEGEDGAQTPPGALSPVDDPQLQVSPKRQVETMELDMDSSAELPALQKKARADSGHSSAGEEDYQWDNIPQPRRAEDRTSSLFPLGNETMVLGKPFSEFSSSVGLSRGGRAEKADCVTIGEKPLSGDSTGGGACAGEEESLYTAASDLTHHGIDQSRPVSTCYDGS